MRFGAVGLAFAFAGVSYGLGSGGGGAFMRGSTFTDSVECVNESPWLLYFGDVNASFVDGRFA